MPVDTSSSPYRGAMRVGIGALLFLLVLAIIYYRERMIMTDASLVSFRRINIGDLESSQRRYGAFLTELVPLLLAKARLPLQVILVAYSASFAMLYTATAWVIGCRWKQPKLALAFVLHHFLFCSDAFYWTNIEIHQALAYAVLALAILQKTPSFRTYAASGVLAFLAIFTHPLCIAAIWAAWIFLLIERQLPPEITRRAWVISAFLLGLTTLKLTLSLNQGYDGRRLGSLAQLEYSTLANAFSSNALQTFYQDCITNYWAGLMLVGLLLVHFLLHKQWKHLLWLTGSVGGVLFLIGVVFGGGHYHYYLEGEWQILGFLIALPTLYCLSPRVDRRLLTAILLGIVVVRSAYMLHAAPVFSARIRFLESILTRMRSSGLHKVVLVANDACPEKTTFFTWSMATETMTLSALHGDDPVRTAASLYPNELWQIPASPDSLRSNFNNLSWKQLNPHYFRIDTSVTYTVLACDTFATAR